MDCAGDWRIVQISLASVKAKAMKRTINQLCEVRKKLSRHRARFASRSGRIYERERRKRRLVRLK